MRFDVTFGDTTSNITFTVPEGFVPINNIYLPCVQYDSDGYSTAYLRIYAGIREGTVMRDTGHSSYTWVSTQTSYICAE